MVRTGRSNTVDRGAKRLREILIGHRHIGLPSCQRCVRIWCSLCRLRWLLQQFGLNSHRIRVLTVTLGFSYSKGPSLRYMRQFLSRLLVNASSTFDTVVALTNLRHHSGHARAPTSRILPEETQVSRFQRPGCGPAKSVIGVYSNQSTAGCISHANP